MYPCHEPLYSAETLAGISDTELGFRQTGRSLKPSSSASSARVRPTSRTWEIERRVESRDISTFQMFRETFGGIWTGAESVLDMENASFAKPIW